MFLGCLLNLFQFQEHEAVVLIRNYWLDGRNTDCNWIALHSGVLEEYVDG